jgi:M6 family metalloprotease-like protein
MPQKRIIRVLILMLVIASSGCRKDAGTKENDDKGNQLSITDGSTCKFINASGRYDVGYGFPHDPDRVTGTGTKNIAVIFVDFPDAIATRTPQDVLSLMSPASENFVSTISHGKANVVFQPKFKWYRMSKPSDQYGYDQLTFDLHKQYIQEAVSLADPEYDFTKIDDIVIICNPDRGAIVRSSSFMGLANNGIHADGRTMTNAMTLQRDLATARGFLFPHEFGHSMGVPDLYAYTGPLHGFVGDFSIMGNQATAPTYNAWEQWLFGWFTDNQVTCVRGKGSGSVQLTPVETGVGMKLLVLPIDNTSAVIVEDRRAIDYDRGIIKEGPIVYLIDTKIKNGEGVLKVLPIDLNNQTKRDAPLSIGQAITYGSITVKCTASDKSGSTITYERN